MDEEDYTGWGAYTDDDTIVRQEFNDPVPEPGGVWMPKATYERLLRQSRVFEERERRRLEDEARIASAPGLETDEGFWHRVRRALAGER